MDRQHPDGPDHAEFGLVGDARYAMPLEGEKLTGAILPDIADTMEGLFHSND